MPSTATTRNRLEKQGTGENTNTWGSKLNSTGLDLVDEALDGYESIAVSGNLTLTATNYVSDQSRKRFLKFTGSTTANITIPAVSKLYFVWNASSAVLTFTTGGATTAAVAAGAKRWVVCDGSGVYLDTSATDAATSATAAASSASAAATSATSAATSATSAGTSATNAATSATNAATSATAADASADAAAVSAAEAASAAEGGITALTGDVTATGPGSVAATIANNAVSLAKMATVASKRYLGRTSGSTGNVEALTKAQLQSDLDISGTNTGDQTTITGNAGTATTLQTARNFSITGGATAAAVSFNGSAAVALNVTGLDMGSATAGTLAVARGGTGTTTSTGTGNVVLSASPTLTGTAAIGSLTATGTIAVAGGTQTAPGYSFTGDSNTGMFSDFADTLVFAVGGNDAVQIDTNDVTILTGFRLIIQTETPASASASGTQGTIAFDSNYAYFCTSVNTWKRVAIATW